MGDNLFRTLSKSDFKAARDCPAKLYYRELGYPNADDSDEYLALLADGGYMVEAIARALYPSGKLLDYGGDPRESVERTRKHLEADDATLFEATLLSGRKLARVDILERVGDTLRLVEVKAKSFDSSENSARVAEGKSNLFRQLKKPYPIASAWREYLEDVAFQVLVLHEMYPGVEVKPFLCLVDKAKSTLTDGLPKYFRLERRLGKGDVERVHRAHFDGEIAWLERDRIVIEVDVSAEVDEILAEISAAADDFETAVAGELVRLPAEIGVRCAKCEYRLGDERTPNGFVECWHELAGVAPAAIDLYHASSLKRDDGLLIDHLVASGKASLLDIPEENCTKKDGSVGAIATRQLIQIRNTRNNTVWIGEGLAGALSSAVYPLHFVDFEACRLAIPPHANMRPYGQIAFQWSCHTRTEAGGAVSHIEWLNTEDLWPNEKFAESLMNAIGSEGTILTWSHFEASVLKYTDAELQRMGRGNPALSAWIDSVTGTNRILDLCKLTEREFFHPDMGGRTSIKVVLDALWRSDATMRAQFEEMTDLPANPAKGPYASLPALEIAGKQQEVAEGTGAIRAYQAMMYGAEKDDTATRDGWRKLLLQYCELDTLAMVLIWDYWHRALRQ